MAPISPPVLYYHSVAPETFDSWCLSWLTMPMDIFEDQLKFLVERGFESLFLEQWHEYRQGQQEAGSRCVCLTFDDGLLDNWVYVYPLLRKYGLRATFFVSPECVDPRPVVRPNLDDVREGKLKSTQLEPMGYCSWEELRIMQASGLVDIQSHTMSHTKYISGKELHGFYYGGHQGMYSIWNQEPPTKPFYMADHGFEMRLPLGSPIFEESSAVVTRRHVINPELTAELEGLANTSELKDPLNRPAYEAEARKSIDKFSRRGKLISQVETEASFTERLHYEIAGSKEKIEKELEKPIRFLCWPHGDNSTHCHKIARDSGYLATTSGKMEEEAHRLDRIPRIGAPAIPNKEWLSRKKLQYKLFSEMGRQPYKTVARLNAFKNRMIKMVNA